MKKFYSLLAGAMVSMTAFAQVNVDDIAGKYRLVGEEPSYYIEDHGFDVNCIVNVDRTGDKSFSIDNFFYGTTNYDGDAITINGTWQDAGDWASYPTVQDIQFQWDNTDMYLYNPVGEGDHAWLFFSANSFRLLPKYVDDTVQLFLWPNNKILLSYYDSETGSYDNPAVEFKNLGPWNAETNPEGSLHLERLPLYQTVSKRGLNGEYTLKAVDAEGNEVSCKVNIERDGTEYIMTGFFGDTDHPVTFTWDDTDAGIRAAYIDEYDAEGNCTFNFSSYAPNMNLYASFTEEGNIAFDQDLYFFDGENTMILENAVICLVEEIDALETTGYFEDYDYNPTGFDSFTIYYNWTSDNTVEFINFLGTGKTLNIDLSSDPDDYGYIYPAFSSEDGINDGNYFYFDAEDIPFNGELISAFYVPYCYFAPDYGNYFSICYWSDTLESWVYINTYIPYGQAEGVAPVVVGNEAPQYFDLQGRRMSQPKGITIVKQNGQVRKQIF